MWYRRGHLRALCAGWSALGKRWHYFTLSFLNQRSWITHGFVSWKMQHAVGCLGTACPCPCLCICLLRVKSCSGGDGPPQWTAGDGECMHTANLQAHVCIYVLYHCCYVSVWGPSVTLGVSFHYQSGHRICTGWRVSTGWDSFCGTGQMSVLGVPLVGWALFCNICTLSLVKTCFYMLGKACALLYTVRVAQGNEWMLI